MLQNWHNRVMKCGLILSASHVEILDLPLVACVPGDVLHIGGSPRRRSAIR